MQGFILRYHCCSEKHFSSRLDVNFDKVIWVLNVGQRLQGISSWCVSKSVSRAITMQEFIQLSFLHRNALYFKH